MNNFCPHSTTKTFILYASLFFFAGCSDSPKKEYKDPVKETDNSFSVVPEDIQIQSQKTDGKETVDTLYVFDSTRLDLSSFTEVPEEMIGCGCSFSFSREDFEKGKCIYFYDDIKTANIILNGRIENVQLIEYSDEGDFYQIFANKHLRVRIDFIKGEKVDYEFTEYRGKMTITNTNGLEKEIEVYGGCGC